MNIINILLEILGIIMAATVMGPILGIIFVLFVDGMLSVINKDISCEFSGFIIITTTVLTVGSLIIAIIFNRLALWDAIITYTYAILVLITVILFICFIIFVIAFSIYDYFSNKKNHKKDR